MPFDGVPSHWSPGGPEPQGRLSRKDKLVALGIASALLVCTAANCRILLIYMLGS